MFNKVHADTHLNYNNRICPFCGKDSGFITFNDNHTVRWCTNCIKEWEIIKGKICLIDKSILDII